MPKLINAACYNTDEHNSTVTDTTQTLMITQKQFRCVNVTLHALIVSATTHKHCLPNCQSLIGQCLMRFTPNTTKTPPW